MKKEIKVLAIVLAAFALVLCLASCNELADYSFKTFLVHFLFALGLPSDMPKFPVYSRMSSWDLQKFNSDMREDANGPVLNAWISDGTFYNPEFELKQDRNGNWYNYKL